ncbi:MAG: right-handed parallel beta-helix repeat-containing protein [Clostridia bacterium]|nr:right-handed parallel beta-helix repeat-containing protein [Clostridia bacterium]
MTNAKSTKRALLLSALAIVMSVAMLIGSTFAWFTDSASTAVNTIQSGKLDVALEYSLDNGANWSNAEGQTLSFKKAAGAPANEEVLWEPGCTYELPLIRVRNNGNLALKYEISVIGGKGDLKLFDVISFTAAIDGAAEVPLSTFTGHLDAKDASSQILIKGHMDEDAGNEYQDLTIESIAINVLATQYTYEYDSNSNQYDKDAIYGDVKVTTDAELKAAIEDPEIKVIAIDGNLTYDWGGDSYANSKALLMKGNTFLGADADASITFAGYGSANPIVDTVFKNIIVKDTTVGDDESSWEHGYLEFENLTAVNVTFADSIMLSGSNYLMDCTIKNPVASWYGLWIEDGSTVIKDSYFTGTRAVKIHEYYGSNVESVVIDNCVFNTLSEKPGVVIGALDATTKVTIKNSIFASCQPGDQGKYIYETDTPVNTFKFVEKNNTLATGVSGNADLKNAIDAGEDTIVLGGGEYSLPTLANTEGVTIIGAEGATIGGESVSTGFGGNFGKNTTIKNVTFTGSSNAVRYSYAKGGTTVFENCTFASDGTYGFHIDESNGATFIFNDCTFSGFNAFASDLVKVTFNNCTFLHNGNYGHTNIWSIGEFNGCTFGEGATFGTRGSGVIYVDGVKK